jgi:outer membrane protein assembly factor BamB
MLGLVATVFLILGAGTGFTVYYLGANEDRDREEAEQSFGEGQFDRAVGQYAKLVQKYPESPRQDEYHFFQELSAVRVLPMHTDVKGAFDQVSTFLKERKDHPLFAAHGKAIGDALIKLLNDAAKSANENPTNLEAQTHFQRGQQVLDELRALNKDWAPEEQLEGVEAAKGQITERIQKEKQRRELIARLQDLDKLPPTEAVRRLRDFLRTEARQFDQDPDVKKIEEELYEKHVRSIGFDEEAPVVAKRPVEDAEGTLLVQPVVAPSGDGPPLSAERVVFALVRGVLYALRQSDGEIQWARRVGIDTAQLPLRVPPAGNTPELALVLSADTLTLTAVNPASNATLWKRPLGAASLGRPVIVDRRVYVPTLNGEVQEIELARGELLGRYKLGQSLSAGGARFGETKQIFFPGDESCVYVLDVAARRCQAILYTDHPIGSLRGEPILLPSEDDPTVPGYLVLSQAHGLDGTLLHTFRLLPSNPGAAGGKEAHLRVDSIDLPEQRLRGWPFFPPYRDPEKLVTVTDAGVMGLFGINQAHNKDAPLFPLVRVPGMEDGTIELSGRGTARGWAQVVFARENDLWVLARGRLLRYLLTFDQSGPRVVPDASWTQPLDLGSPLHESQTDDDGRTLFLVTQSPNGQACLATAVDAETGRIRWQRQLGLVCHGDPQHLGNGVVALDQGGGLFLFDPAKHPADLDMAWQSAGRGLAKPLPEGSTGSIWLVPGPDGQSVFEFACTEPGNRLIVREYHAGQLAATEHTFDLLARLAGSPAVGEKRILLPLGNGDTRQLRLPLNPTGSVNGPNWHLKSSPIELRGHVVWLGGEEFLATDGRRGVRRWQFGEDDIWSEVPPGKEFAVQLTEPIAGIPIILSRPGGATPLRVCLADVNGTIYLFEGNDLKLARQWELKESITAGPFVRDGMIGCVLAGRRLVWLDPAKDEKLWKYDTPGEGIIGQPQIADGQVIVADVSGRFVGLDPATGVARGPGYELRASVGPAATPVGFGTGRAFAPLTDGTVLLLPLRHLDER